MQSRCAAQKIFALEIPRVAACVRDQTSSLLDQQRTGWVSFAATVEGILDGSRFEAAGASDAER